jgi:hypothetical protein
MKIHKISWFDEFECMGGECPQTCCKGWLIPLDEEDAARFKRERGRLSLELFMATRAYTSNRMNLGSGECRFHTPEGLCKLQIQKGHDFIPWACRSFPRFYRNYGNFEERYLDLSCIAAAKMFVKNVDNLCLAEDEDEPATRLCTTNDDREFMDALLKIRREMCGMGAVTEESKISSLVASQETKRTDFMASISDFMNAVYTYSCRLQDTYARGGTYEDLPAFAEYVKQCTAGEQDKYLPEDERISFPLPVEILKDFVETALYNFGQRRTGPELYTLLSDALKITDKYRRDPAGFTDMVSEFLEKNEQTETVLRSYMSYYLYQYFLGAYETYSFRKITALGVIHTNMLFLMMMTAASGTSLIVRPDGKLLEDDFAYIIAIYNRKAFFNETIEDSMYGIFER